MKLSELKLLFVDCQTTGMRPPSAHLLEIGWSVASAAEPEPKVHSHLVQLPEDVSIPRRVGEITGWKDEDLSSALAPAEVARLLQSGLAGGVDAAAIHYAQFEKPFLADLYRTHLEREDLPFRLVCTHQLTKRLFPNLPRQNIRATAGFFGPPVTGLNRAGTFVRATWQIWRGLCAELERLGLSGLDEIEEWMKSSPRPKATRYEYRLDRLKRLDLPDSPGVYRMLAKNGEVLYVGKATSLRSRVNSYFRGKKGRDTRKLEMLTQVWDLQVTSCATPLEAALLESDEIKRLNPPYNVVLKTGRRHLIFYSRNFSGARREQSTEFPIGPFRNSNWIEHLRLLAYCLKHGKFDQPIFWDPLPEADLRAGFDIFCAQHGLQSESLASVRALLAYGMWLYRAYDEEAESEAEEPAAAGDKTESDATTDSENDPPTETPLTPEDIAGKYERLLRRAAAEHWRAKKLTRLLNSRVQLGERTLEFRQGRMNPDLAQAEQSAPWSGLEVDTFDRMSILLSELNKHGHRIDRL